jgi:hypothetical protein
MPVRISKSLRKKLQLLAELHATMALARATPGLWRINGTHKKALREMKRARENSKK